MTKILENECKETKFEIDFNKKVFIDTKKSKFLDFAQDMGWNTVLLR